MSQLSDDSLFAPRDQWSKLMVWDDKFSNETSLQTHIQIYETDTGFYF